MWQYSSLSVIRSAVSTNKGSCSSGLYLAIGVCKVAHDLVDVFILMKPIIMEFIDYP